MHTTVHIWCFKQSHAYFCLTSWHCGLWPWVNLWCHPWRAYLSLLGVYRTAYMSADFDMLPKLHQKRITEWHDQGPALFQFQRLWSRVNPQVLCHKHLTGRWFGSCSKARKDHVFDHPQVQVSLTFLTILAKTIYTEDKVVVNKVLHSVWFDDLEEIGAGACETKCRQNKVTINCPSQVGIMVHQLAKLQTLNDFLNHFLAGSNFELL